MSLEISLRQICGKLSSNKGYERKRSADALKELLTRNAAPDLLSDNTRKNHGFSWNDLFDHINESIIMETEKSVLSKTFYTVTYPLLSSILHLSVAGSIKGKAYIKCEKIMKACHFVLNNQRLADAFGDAYLTLLYKHVLSSENYPKQITHSDWEDLLDLSTKACFSTRSKLDDFIKLKLLWLVIKKAGECVQFSIPLRNSLSKMTLYLKKLGNNQKALEVVTDIMILTLEMLYLESRLSVCEFAENNLPLIFQVYGQNMDLKKKSRLFKLLDLTITIHHTQGRRRNEEFALAYDWDNWNTCINSIMEIICLEAVYIQKNYKQNSNILQCPHFARVAASTYFVIFKMSAEQSKSNCDSENSAKRAKFTINKFTVFGDLLSEFKITHIPWTHIIQMFIEHYGGYVSSNDYKRLLKILEDLVGSNNMQQVCSAFENLTCSVLRNVLSQNDNSQSSWYELIIPLWNACVRNSTSVTPGQSAIHSVMQSILSSNLLQYHNVKPLFIAYFDKGMPVNDHSVDTLVLLFKKFFAKCCQDFGRIKCITWFTNGPISKVGTRSVRELFLALLSNENIGYLCKTTISERHDLHNTLFGSIDQSILFANFEFETSECEGSRNESVLKNLEINNEVNAHLRGFMQVKLFEYKRQLQKKDIELLEYLQLMRIALVYYDTILSYFFQFVEKFTKTIASFKDFLQVLFTVSMETLKSDSQIRDKNLLLQSLQSILLEDYYVALNTILRECIDGDFFRYLNDILVSHNTIDDEESDLDMSFNALKHNCLLFIAAYCKKQQNRRETLLKLILNSISYNFSCQLDIESALKCIRILNQPDVENRPLELTFRLMKFMCKNLFRDSKATKGIIESLTEIIDRAWLHSEDMRGNCVIMIKSYLLRCDSKYYPPNVVTLIYKCAAKIAKLNYKGDKQFDCFKDALISNLKADFFGTRLYCSYLIDELSDAVSEGDIKSCFASLRQMFTISVPQDNATIMKDELNNRTASVLHAYYRFAKNKPILVHHIIVEILMTQREKSLDKQLVSKILKIIVQDVTQTSPDDYLDKHILFILQRWLEKKYSVMDLPLHLFFDPCSHNQVSVKYMNFLVSTDILWRHGGFIKNSEALQKFKQTFEETAIIEKSFLNIIVLSLPYIIIEKYDIKYRGRVNKEMYEAAPEVFSQSRIILTSDKWHNLFHKNLGELVLLAAINLKDHADAKKVFQVDIPKNDEIYYHSKEIFCAILIFFSNLIHNNIMRYLCQTQPLVVLKVLFVLWENVMLENLIQFKIVSLHTFVTVIEKIPLDLASDSIFSNFAINCITSALKKAERENEVNALAKALCIILTRFQANKMILFDATLTKILSVMFVKKGNKECGKVLNFVVGNFKGLGDLYTIMTQEVTDTCNSEEEVSKKLVKYVDNLSNGITATLPKMLIFLNAHKKFIKDAFNKLDGEGFSDEYEKSILHKVIVALCNILKSSTNDEELIEASNCLAEIGTYDMKTYVTVPPIDTKQLINAKPKEYFAMITVKSLLEIILDENPTLSYEVTKALYKFMKFKDSLSVDFGTGLDNNRIFDCLVSRTCESFAQYVVHDVSTLWNPNNNEDHLQWIKRITLSLLKVLETSSNYLNSFLTICELKPSICRKILPALVGLIVEHSSEEQVQILGQEINQVFSIIWDKSFYDSGVNSEDHTVSKNSCILDHDQKMVVQYLLDVIDTIRMQRSHSNIRIFEEPYDLRHMNLECDKLAWAATLADKNITAIYYAEMWAVVENGGVPPSSPERTAILDAGENLQKILRNCFVSIGELDAIDGCGTAHLTSEVEKRKHLLNTGQYSDALLLHDIALSSGTQADNALQQDVVMSLHKSGMHHLALQYIKSFPENYDLSVVKYDCLSYLGDWSEIVDITELEETTKKPVWDVDVVIKSFRYACLKECLTARACDALGVRLTHSLNIAKLATSKLCRILNMENCQSVYKVVANLHLFRDIEDYCSVRIGRIGPSELLSRWQVDMLPSYKNFRHLEALMSQRSLILEHAARHYENILPNIIDLQLQYVDMGLSNGKIQMSQRLLQSVKNFKQTQKVVFVESQIAWAKGHKDIALALLHGVVADDIPDVKLSAMCSRQYGLWMAECRRDNAREIISKYLDKSLKTLKKADHAETRYKVYHDIAKFADAEYKQIVSYMSSTVFENKVKCIDTMKDIAASFRVPHGSLSKDERRALTTNDRFMKLDEDEVSRTRAEKESFLSLAMRYYLYSLRFSEETNLSIFRVISLWFENSSFEFKERSEANLLQYLQAVPSWKYIAVLPQLAPRITTEETVFANYLKQILERCALDHPHHTLPILFNLKNSDKDNCILNASKGSSAVAGSSRAPVEPRIQAADKLVRELAKRHNLKSIVMQLERLCDAFISFAYFTPTLIHTRPQFIPSGEALLTLKNLDALPIPTVTLPIAKNGVYSSVPHITEFGQVFELVGGINCPKKITCTTSDGKCRILLIKGEDDLRQDAVMQQVFNIVNKLLENNPITSKNKLLIRTYKVVPMSRRSGVLEWCEGTIPLGTYLMEAHTRYRPNDITPAEARTKLKICHESRKSNLAKLRVFMEILADFKPVFHNFFTENYHDPITWYERRLAYTRSIASSSMVGYILGLGDRHVHNILIDKITAEVIHIDLGIAFDQGQALPTPETIPFRLTQDIIAGFGCCGVEGIFRRCCEKTMQLLRDNQETLLTILEVLLCDPLYSWTLKGPLKNSSLYSLRGGEPAGSGLAERALLSVGGKLSGAEGAAPAAVSVAGQVARLIGTATDPVNLSRLFHGWQPYL